jgi:hypothetical protein
MPAEEALALAGTMTMAARAAATMQAALAETTVREPMLDLQEGMAAAPGRTLRPAPTRETPAAAPMALPVRTGVPPETQARI